MSANRFLKNRSELYIDHKEITNKENVRNAFSVLARNCSRLGIHIVVIIQSARVNADNYSSRVELFTITFVGCRSVHVCAEREIFANHV